MRQFIERHTFWAIVLVLLAALLLWLVFAVWPPWLAAAIGRKKTFVNTLLNGVTLGGLYFLVASGFTLVFGLMRNVNLAHGSMYLLGAYIVTTWRRRAEAGSSASPPPSRHRPERRPPPGAGLPAHGGATTSARPW